jgi:hypothetical protein
VRTFPTGLKATVNDASLSTSIPHNVLSPTILPYGEAYPHRTTLDWFFDSRTEFDIFSHIPSNTSDVEAAVAGATADVDATNVGAAHPRSPGVTLQPSDFFDFFGSMTAFDNMSDIFSHIPSNTSDAEAAAAGATADVDATNVGAAHPRSPDVTLQPSDFFGSMTEFDNMTEFDLFPVAPSDTMDVEAAVADALRHTADADATGVSAVHPRSLGAVADVTLQPSFSPECKLQIRGGSPTLDQAAYRTFVTPSSNPESFINWDLCAD